MAPTKQTLHCAMKALYGCFFYRLIEDISKQKYNTIFLVMTDTFTPEACDMCMTLYDEAERLGLTMFLITMTATGRTLHNAHHL
jgi:hypothetical protein